MGKQTKQPARQPAGWSERKKNIVTVAVILALVAVIAVICAVAITQCSKSTKDPVAGGTETLEPVTCGMPESESATDYVCLTVEYVTSDGKTATGDIVVHLREDVAPITVANFKTLVSSGFYDGLTFHRIYPGFMIQGGDPAGNGTGGSSQTIKGEFAENGVENPLSHKRGVISMARSTSYNSASSQFFIMHADNPESLDGKYAAFGEVIFGMETVDGIAGTPRKDKTSVYDEGTTPVTAPKILRAYFVTGPAAE